MAVGGCFCGRVRIEFKGEPITSALCHCADCRKLTGAPFTYDLVVKTAELEISGSPKEVAKKADSGNDIKNYFCPDCGTQLYGHKMDSGVPNEITIIRAGVFDDIDFLNKWKPAVEIYTDRRLAWVSPLEGANQVGGMLSI